MLIGYGGLTLPYDVPANEFYNLEGQKMSTSRGWALGRMIFRTAFVQMLSDTILLQVRRRAVTPVGIGANSFAATMINSSRLGETSSIT